MTKDLVFTSGTVPSVNGTIPDGIEAQTVSPPKLHNHCLWQPHLTCPTVDGCYQQHCHNLGRGRDVMGLRVEDDSIPRQHYRLCCHEQGVQLLTS